MKYVPYVTILILSLVVSYLLGSIQGQKESLVNLNNSIKITSVPTLIPSPSPTSPPLPTIQVNPTVTSTQESKKCDYTRDQLRALFKMAGISEEDTNTFFNAFTGNCFTTNKNNTNSFNCTTRYMFGTSYTSCD